MTDHLPAASGHAGHGDPMSHVPPPSLWPLLVTAGLTVIPFGVLSLLGTLKGFGPLGDPTVGILLIFGGLLVFIYCLMGWGHQIISEKILSHDAAAQQRDLQLFLLLFLCGELMAFAAVFAYFYVRHGADPAFAPPHAEGFHFGGPLVAYATFILLSSSVTCEFAHHALLHHRPVLAKALYALTIVLGVAFLGFQGFEWGELINRGFTPLGLNNEHSSFSALFYVGTGFHGLHVAIGLVMLFMVLARIQTGHFRDDRHFSAVAASWYWHFVDIVWVILFITVYVVG